MTKCKRCTSCTAGILCQCKSTIIKQNKNVDHPDHYLKDSGHEVIDVINSWNLNFELGNAVKYIARAGKKDSGKMMEDLEKAKWYIQHQINELKNNN
jgi:hypothetical protein